MKTSSKLFSLVFVFLSLLIFNSCEKDQNLITPSPIEELESTKERADVSLSFEQALVMDEHYTAYMDARAILFEKLEAFEIDLFGIHTYLKENRIESVCQIAPNILKDFQGGTLYADIYCEGIKENLLQLSTKYQAELAQMDKEEIQSTFAYLPRSIVNRIPSCLEGFNNYINDVDESCAVLEGMYGHSQCLDQGYSDAFDAYDDCCAGGGSGCPPSSIDEHLEVEEQVRRPVGGIDN